MSNQASQIFNMGSVSSGKQNFSVDSSVHKPQQQQKTKTTGQGVLNSDSSEDQFFNAGQGVFNSDLSEDQFFNEKSFQHLPGIPQNEKDFQSWFQIDNLPENDDQTLIQQVNDKAIEQNNAANIFQDIPTQEKASTHYLRDQIANQLINLVTDSLVDPVTNHVANPVTGYLANPVALHLANPVAEEMRGTRRQRRQEQSKNVLILFMKAITKMDFNRKKKKQ